MAKRRKDWLAAANRYRKLQVRVIRRDYGDSWRDSEANFRFEQDDENAMLSDLAKQMGSVRSQTIPKAKWCERHHCFENNGWRTAVLRANTQRLMVRYSGTYLLRHAFGPQFGSILQKEVLAEFLSNSKS